MEPLTFKARSVRQALRLREPPNGAHCEAANSDEERRSGVPWLIMGAVFLALMFRG
jgi:hypothetical protein